MAKLLNALGLHRTELRAWAMYDWANSAFQCTVIAAVFPRFFADYASASTTCTGRSDGCSPNRTRCSKPSGSG